MMMMMMMLADDADDDDDATPHQATRVSPFEFSLYSFDFNQYYELLKKF